MKPQIKLSTVAFRSTVTLAFVSFAFFAGCATEPESHVVSAPPPPPPTTTTTTNAPVAVTVPNQPQQTTVTRTTSVSGTGNPAVVSVVTEAPPALQQETVQVRPTSSHVWIPGHWSWRVNRYEWIPGQWEIPPSSDSVWVPPHYEREGNVYKFYEGYWQ